MDRFTFELTLKGGAGRPVKRHITIEAATVYHAWRRIGGQLVNTREGREVIVQVRLLEQADDNAPLIAKVGRRARLIGF
ncbi:hypothetical protein ACFQVB_19390 [Paraburkholderia humisilvae]|uniref:hypothetical protein n=1 Tax=Paraburkholderia humisilvae TaxID=627669 RepID=UPI00361B91BF